MKNPINNSVAASSCIFVSTFSMFLSLLLALPAQLIAEGSKDFVTYGGFRMFLDTRDAQQLKVYANAGETINVGASHTGLWGGFITVYDPSGNLAATFDNTSGSAGLAIINNSNEEAAGPTGGGSTNGSGYVPGTVAVPAGQSGVWTVIFDYPSYDNIGYVNILNNAPWTRAANQPNSRRVVLAWDITVSQNGAGNAGGTLLEGRVYTNEHISLLNGNGFNTSPVFYVLTNDGYLYEVDFHNADPFRFPISSNSLGLTDGTRMPIYKSKPENNFTRDYDPASWADSSIYLYEPQARDNGVLVNNKIFFNIPNSDLPTTAEVTDIFRTTTYSTWLRKELEILVVDSLYLVGDPGSGNPCSPGSIESGNPAYFVFETNLGGVATLELDLDNNGSFSNPMDRKLSAPIVAGIDELPWDGLDGLGNPMPIQNGFAFSYRGAVKFGELHIAYTDVENAPGGVTFNWLNAPAGYATDLFYYDHSDITSGGPVSGGGTPGNALPTNVPFTYAGNSGNDQYLDHWFLIELDIPSTPMTVDVVGNCLLTPDDTQLVAFGNGFDQPADIAQCGDERLFIAEQKGKVWILDAAGNKLPTPFLDLQAMVGSQGVEQGLLGIAFHPEYLNNGLFYVNYTMLDGNTRISRFNVSASDPNTADPASELVLMDIAQPFENNNGGCLKFGPDGYLYIATGDGGGEGDPQKNAQNLLSPLGKLLRIDVDNGSPYGIPTDNPFMNNPSALGEIWALGLHNPWRFSFDRATGDLWLGDVGQDGWEEIDFQPAAAMGGENYGWRCYEGNQDYSVAGCSPVASMKFPAFQYPNFHTTGCAVVGGFVYRGCGSPGLYGQYVFTDYCSGRIWSRTPSGQVREVAHFPDSHFSAFGENSEGEIFMAGHGDGTVYKLVSAVSPLFVTNESCAQESDGQASFNIPTNQFSAIVWSDGSTQANRTGLAAGNYTVTVTTVNGCEFSEAVEIVAGNGPSSTPMLMATAESCAQANDGQINFVISISQFASFAWSDGSTLANRTGLVPGIYIVTVTTPNGCEFSETVEITVGGPAVPVVQVVQDSILSTTAIAAQYQWLFNGVPIAGATQSAYVATETGNYSVIITNIQGCTASSALVFLSLTASLEKLGFQSVMLTPNPFDGNLYLRVTSMGNLDFSFWLTDASGKTLLLEKHQSYGGFDKDYDLSYLPAGTYLCTISTEKGEWSRQVIKK